MIFHLSGISVTVPVINAGGANIAMFLCTFVKQRIVLSLPAAMPFSLDVSLGMALVKLPWSADAVWIA